MYVTNFRPNEQANLSSDRPNGSAVRLVYGKCRSADSDSSFLIVASADADADSPAPIEWGLEGEACGLQPRFCCYVFIPPFFIRAQAMSGLSLFIFSESVRCGVLIEL